MAKVLLGSQGVIPNKKFPNKSFNNEVDLNLVLSESEKENNDFELVKRLVNNYEEIGRRQIYSSKDKIVKMYNLANGIIDKSDYIKDNTEHRSEIEILDGQDLEYDLEFYPIIPNIVKPP